MQGYLWIIWVKLAGALWIIGGKLGSSLIFYFVAINRRKCEPKPIPIPQNKESNQKGHSFDVRRSRRHRPAYTRERAAAMFLGSIV